MGIEWVLWHYGTVIHPYIDHTSLPLVSYADLGMRMR